MIGTLFSFIDKLVSSFSTTVVSLGVAMIGYTTTLPEITDACTTELVWFYIIMAVGFPLAGLICNVVAMKFYPLDKEKMEEIQHAIAEVKKNS